MHQFYRHQGYRVVLINLREQGTYTVYIIRGKNLLKSIASKCIRCRITRRNLLQQQMRHLPAFRFKTYCAPFSSVALDFFGLLKIKKTRNVVINGSCLVIVCNTTRVIHLEITETQSTNDFLLAWRQTRTLGTRNRRKDTSGARRTCQKSRTTPERAKKLDTTYS